MQKACWGVPRDAERNPRVVPKDSLRAASGPWSKSGSLPTWSWSAQGNSRVPERIFIGIRMKIEAPER